jgi:hypothetical protein
MYICHRCLGKLYLGQEIQMIFETSPSGSTRRSTEGIAKRECRRSRSNRSMVYQGSGWYIQQCSNRVTPSRQEIIAYPSITIYIPSNSVSLILQPIRSHQGKRRYQGHRYGACGCLMVSRASPFLYKYETV